MRYEIQRTGLSHTLRRNVEPVEWETVAKAFTERGARRVWWRWVNKPVSLAYIYRMYDRKADALVEP